MYAPDLTHASGLGMRCNNLFCERRARARHSNDKYRFGRRVAKTKKFGHYIRRYCFDLVIYFGPKFADIVFSDHQVARFLKVMESFIILGSISYKRPRASKNLLRP